MAGSSPSSSSTATPKTELNPTHARIAQLSSRVERLAIHKDHCKVNDFKDVQGDLSKMQTRMEKVESTFRKTMLPRLASVMKDFESDFANEKEEARRGLEDDHKRLVDGIEKTFMMLLGQEQQKRQECEQQLITSFDQCLGNLREAIAKEHDITAKEKILRLHLDRDLPRLRAWREEETKLREGMESTILDHCSKRIRELTDSLDAEKAARYLFFTSNRDRLETIRNEMESELKQEKVKRQAGEAMLFQLIKNLDGQIHLEDHTDEIKNTLQRTLDRYGTTDEQSIGT